MNYLHLQSTQSNQRGVVLFIAMIALIVMSLAAAALIRSVDTNTLITGNLSFKQSAVVSSDRGIETALAWVNTTAIANPATLDADSTANGYFSTFDTLDLDDRAVLKAEATWDNNSAAATGGNILAGIEDGTNNDIRFIVQRMCREPAAPTTENCQFGESKSGSGSKKVKYRKGLNLKPLPSAIYRVTVRVVGPKNTVSYTQMYAY
jgi:type IV pilus assembly protein PilX